MRDRRQKDWFWVDNALVDRKDLNLYEKMLYICLARHAGNNEYAFPKLSTLCNELGVKDTRTIVKYIKSLEEKGLIEVEKRKGSSNLYYLNNVEVPTSDVPTFNVPTASNVGTVPTSNVGRGSSMKCHSKNTNIKNTNLNIITTTKLDNLNKIDQEVEASKKTSSSSLLKTLDKDTIFQIKSILHNHGLNIATCKNIMALVEQGSIDLARIKLVLMTAKLKKWDDGAVYQALRNNWEIKAETSTTTVTPENMELKIKWLKHFGGIYSDKELRAEVEKLIIPISLETLNKNKSKLAKMTIFEFKSHLASLKGA
ncbi:helix-turn-helix domain-containing protein [Fusobacterium mortiferum]|uniref:Helix-turn-helix domain-containing protein n=1 Tax=Fusobacterium mortiferum TaxID=850 RepID=A0ABS2FZ55_FUSMR|nr:helix-turn-helix domain-containing protein [Fusobacterium mortiferum]MBM6874419.1 helix-turn-helix domain-containing protein [Fusobacterium mortiferum]